MILLRNLANRFLSDGFCTMKIFFKERDVTLIYAALRLCKFLGGTPGIPVSKILNNFFICEKYKNLAEINFSG